MGPYFPHPCAPCTASLVYLSSTSPPAHPGPSLPSPIPRGHAAEPVSPDSGQSGCGCSFHPILPLPALLLSVRPPPPELELVPSSPSSGGLHARTWSQAAWRRHRLRYLL